MMGIESQIGKKYDRAETIKNVNTNMVLLNKHVQRLMYHIQIDGVDSLDDNNLAGLNMRLEQIVDIVKVEFDLIVL